MEPPREASPPPIVQDTEAAPLQGPTYHSEGEVCPTPGHLGPAGAEERRDRAKFFIALKDHWIHTAVAYWVQGKTLHYITPSMSHNQVSVELVDPQLTARLNAGNPVNVVLPAK